MPICCTLTHETNRYCVLHLLWAFSLLVTCRIRLLPRVGWRYQRCSIRFRISLETCDLLIACDLQKTWRNVIFQRVTKYFRGGREKSSFMCRHWGTVSVGVVLFSSWTVRLANKMIYNSTDSTPAASDANPAHYSYLNSNMFPALLFVGILTACWH